MLTIEWNAATKDQWQHAYDAAPTLTAYQQHWAYGEALKEMGGTIARAIICKDGQPIALYQCAIRHFFRASFWLGMRGPVWLNTEITDEDKQTSYHKLRNQYPARWPSFHMLMPETGDPTLLKRAGMKCLVSGHSTIVIDLAPSQETLRANMDSKWRNRLTAVQKSDITCHRVGNKPHQYAWLVGAENTQQQRVGYLSLGPKFIADYQTHAGNQSILALRAEKNGENIAGILCLLHGNSATYHIGWSNEQGKHFNAHNLLIWEMMNQLKQKNIRWFDLGGVNTEEGTGIARFKLGTGGTLRTLAGNFA